MGISIASDGLVSAPGSLQRLCENDAGLFQAQKTLLDYSRNATSGWKALASARTTESAARLQAYGYVSGYYRLVHPSSEELAGSATKAVFLSRIPTRVQGNKVSPGTVKSGGTVTVTGTLHYFGDATHFDSDATPGYVKVE